MCGIVGMAAAPGADAPDLRALHDATVALMHRGPDGDGQYAASGVALASTRLSIIDLPGGRQPMRNEDDSVVAVYNGEIWNHRQLRRQLVERGHQFHSHSDTEVLVHGYEEWGDELPLYLDGMFAFAVWDVRRRRLVLARDRLGKKPLYLLQTPRGLAFGSDARSLFLVTRSEPRVDRENVASFLFQRYVNSPETMFAGVVRLPPAHRATYEDGRLLTTAYWDLVVPEAPEPLDPRQLEGLLQRAVEKRLMSDVPVGILLSGGVDSTAILALAQAATDTPLASFTIGFEDAVYDERSAARASAEHFGTDHYELVVGSHDFAGALLRLAWYRDEPIAEASEIPLLLLAELAARHVKVVLTGDGGDELFGGYPKYRTDMLIRAGGSQTAATLGAMLRILGGRRSHRQLDRAARTVRVRDPLARWAGWFRSFEPSVLENVLAPDLRGAATPDALSRALAQVIKPYEHVDVGRRMLLGDLFTYLPDNMLLRSDKVLMGASLEGRMPLLDLDVVQRVSRTPARDRAGLWSSKRVLRSAIKHLVPRHVLHGPKRGFPVPLDRFIGGKARTGFTEIVLSDRALSRGIFRPDQLRSLVGDRPRLGPRELFVLASLELWYRVNVDSVSTAPPALDELNVGLGGHVGLVTGESSRVAAYANGSGMTTRADPAARQAS